MSIFSKKPKQIEDYGKPIYRRFELITTDEEQEKAFDALTAKKGLTREDLMLILKTIKIRSTCNS